MSAGIALGLLLGLLLQYSHYCSMGALSDFFLFRSWRRLRVMLTAMALALIGTQLLVLNDMLDLSGTHRLAAPLAPTRLIIGGVLFGWGMVLAGGCASRNLVRLGGGSLKALLVVLLMLFSASLVASGPLQFLPGILGLGLALPSAPAIPWLPALVLAVGVGGWSLAFQVIRGERIELMTGMALAVLAITAWPLSILIAGQAEPAPASLDLVTRSNDLLLWLAINKMPGFAAALMAGTVIGAFIAANAFGRLRLEVFRDGTDMMRHVVGGVLLGVGGVLAIGDTLAHGIAGMAALSLAAPLALAGMIAGARLALWQLEAGGFLPLLRGLRR